MYAKHARAIQAWSAKSPDNLARVVQLSIVSAHAPFSRIVTDMADAVDGGPSSAAVLYGWKAKAFADIWDEREAIAWNLADTQIALDYAEMSEANAADHALAYLAGFHGLGFAKAGFALQMALGISGCLDVHNLRKAGHSSNVCRMDTSRIPGRRVSPHTAIARAAAYNRIVYSMGGPSGLWDAWCEEMAARYPKRYSSAFHVSSLHCEALGV
jgi:hypothetical protein